MPDSPAPKKPRVCFFSPPLVPQVPVTKLLPVVVNSVEQDARLRAELAAKTGASPVAFTLERTPKGQHVHAAPDGTCGETASGSKLIYSSSKQMRISVATEEGTEETVIEFAFLTRQQDYVPKDKHEIFRELASSPVSDEAVQEVVVTPESRASQVSRKTARKESVAVKNTAKGLVFDYLKNCGIPFKEEEIAAENWNLCHLLSYGIAMNGKDKEGKPFDTQVYKNIFAGTRVFNENMMRIENVLLQLLKDKEAKKITYLSLSSEFLESHILASLTLKISIEAQNGTTLSFSLPFDVTDDRKISHEASTSYYAIIQSLIKNFDKSTESSATAAVSEPPPEKPLTF